MRNVHGLSYGVTHPTRYTRRSNIPVHWVNYDLNKSGQDYSALINYLKSHESWAKPLASSFFVKTTLTAAQLRDGINEHIDRNDGVVVVNVTGQNWATHGANKDAVAWMKVNL